MAEIGILGGPMGLSQLPKRRSAWEIGSNVGGNIGKAVGTGIDIYNTVTKKEDDLAKKTKIDALLQAYGGNGDKTIFGDLKGSARAQRLAQLLAPLDQEMSQKYETIAREQMGIEERRAAATESTQSRIDLAAEKKLKDAERFTPGTNAYIENQIEEYDRARNYARTLPAGDERKSVEEQIARLGKVLAANPYARERLQLAEPVVAPPAPVTPVAPTVKTDLVQTGLEGTQQAQENLISNKIATAGTDKAALSQLKLDLVGDKGPYNLVPAATRDAYSKKAQEAIDAILAQEKVASDAEKAKVAAANKLVKDAETDDKTWATDYINGLKLDELTTKAREARRLLTTMRNEVARGSYATANLANFKETMGAMSGGEYGIAADSPLAAAVGSLPIFGEAISSALATSIFNDPKSAVARVNEAVQSYNSLVDQYANAANIIPSTTPNRDKRAKMIKDSGKYAAVLTTLGGKFEKLPPPGSSKKEPVKAPVKVKEVKSTSGRVYQVEE
jgi:hypothetical protein